jgi:superfamily II DNA or RNA helicase
MPATSVKNQSRRKGGPRESDKAKPKVSYHRKPDDLTMDQWQLALRRQFAEMADFKIKNLGMQEVFSDYSIYNPATKNTYKVAIRSSEPGLNFCSCMDFKTNGLGTCKHIEYILYKINKNRQKAKLLQAGYQPHYTSVYVQYGQERKVRLRIGTEKASEFGQLAKAYFDAAGILKETGYAQIEKFLEKAHALHPDFRCYTDALDFILEKREADKRGAKVAQAVGKGDKFYAQIIKANLFEYQKQGVDFALRTGRCMLADDMGLGKTIQAIGAAEGMKQLFGISKVLIVCPTSLKYQWKSEIEKFTGSDLKVIEGPLFEREKQYTGNEFYKICTYNVVGRDIETINKAGFDLVILDEAQRIKNWQTALAKNVKRVKSKYAMVLTGTPLENKLDELYSLMQVVDPYKLGALFRFVNQHQIIQEETGKVIGYKDLNQIGELLKPVMLRRHKRDVLKQLPSRMDKNLFVAMTSKQLEYYDDAYDIVTKLVNKWIKYKFLSEKERQNLLINLNRMRMACDSTFILDQETRYDTKIGELMSILEEAFESGEHEKVVVFSQWERMTRIVASELDARKIKYENLNGGVPGKEREALFKNFNTDPESKVFLSTDAGGVGLNLQAASLLINLDLPWNPAVLEQRIARIHRMGQKKNVQIINLISQNTIEHQMLDKLKFKSLMASGILDNGDSTVFLGESKFNQMMKQVQELTATAPVPQAATDEVETPTPAAITEQAHAPEITPVQPAFFDDDVAKVTPVENTPAHNEASDLIQSGAGFFSKLLETLNDKPKTDKLLAALVKTDAATGETFLQIPVKNAAIVENGLKLLGQLLGGK